MMTLPQVNPQHATAANPVAFGRLSAIRRIVTQGYHVAYEKVPDSAGHARGPAMTPQPEVINPLAAATNVGYDIVHNDAVEIVDPRGRIRQVYTQADVVSNGQMLGGTFMDYAVPRADTMPNVASKLLEIPATSHRYGIRPGGEGGTTPALGCIINAVVDALSEFGVRHVEMPATPERVWRAIREAQRR